MSEQTLYVRSDAGTYVEADGTTIVAAAKAHLGRRVRRRNLMTSPRLVRDYLTVALSAREHEVFCVLLLDNRHRLIEFVEMFRGTIDGASVHPREVVKLALEHNAAAVALVHNHPSGVAEPSQADEIITARLRDALALVDIRTVDHLIIGGADVVSLAERGLL